MNQIFCTRCGSANHRSFDCSAPNQHLTPPTMPAAPENAPQTQPSAESEARGVAAAPEPKTYKHRFPGYPEVCSAEQLLAFKDKAEMEAYWKQKCGPRLVVTKVWKCDKCGRLHFDAKYPSPSGDESGHPRESKYPRQPFVPFRRKAMREGAFAAEPDLPRREVAERPADKPVEKKVIAKPPRKPLNYKEQQAALF